jgi:predicted acetyltransferase
MVVRVVVALESQKDVIGQLLELNSHEFSRWDGRDVESDGRFGYPYLDLYWTPDEDRHPFLIEVDGRIGGCVLVRGGSPHRMAEFFVLQKFRRQAVGTVAAREVFGLFPGPWEVTWWVDNEDAGKFWHSAVPFPSNVVENSAGNVTLHFVSPL